MWARDRSCELFGGQGGNRTPTAEGGWSTASGAHHLLNLPTVAAASGRELRSRDGTRHREHSLWSRRRDSNPEPAVYKTAALPIELRRRDAHGHTAEDPWAPKNDRARRANGSSAAGGVLGLGQGRSAREQVLVPGNRGGCRSAGGRVRRVGR